MQPTETNRVILIGTLTNAGRRNEQAASRIRYTERGAAIAAFGIELVSPFGEPFALNLEVGNQTAGIELLTEERVGQPIAIEGVLRRRTARDRRYAVADSDLGAIRRETQVVVGSIRLPREDEPIGSSAVWVEGAVATPPRVMSHRSLSDLEIARTSLQVVVRRPSDYPGSRAIVTEEMEVPLAAPLEAEGAALLYRPGNIVRVEGQLDLTLVPQLRNPAVQARLTDLEQSWGVQRAALEANGKSVQEHERQLGIALRRYRNQRARLMETPTLSVLVGFVELVAGQALSTEEVAQVIAEGRRRPERRSVRAAEVPVAVEQSAVDPETHADESPAPLRPRRRVRSEEEVVTAVEQVVEAA